MWSRSCRAWMLTCTSAVDRDDWAAWSASADTCSLGQLRTGEKGRQPAAWSAAAVASRTVVMTRSSCGPPQAMASSFTSPTSSDVILGQNAFLGACTLVLCSISTALVASWRPTRSPCSSGGRSSRCSRRRASTENVSATRGNDGKRFVVAQLRRPPSSGPPSAHGARCGSDARCASTSTSCSRVARA